MRPLNGSFNNSEGIRHELSTASKKHRKSGLLKFPPDGHKRRFKIVDEIRQRQSTAAWKVIYFQRLEFDDHPEEARLGYYIIGKKTGRMFGKWVWGQYTTLLPLSDLKIILKEAKKRGWI